MAFYALRYDKRTDQFEVTNGIQRTWYRSEIFRHAVESKNVQNAEINGGKVNTKLEFKKRGLTKEADLIMLAFVHSVGQFIQTKVNLCNHKFKFKGVDCAETFCNVEPCEDFFTGELERIYRRSDVSMDKLPLIYYYCKVANAECWDGCCDRITFQLKYRTRNINIMVSMKDMIRASKGGFRDMSTVRVKLEGEKYCRSIDDYEYGRGIECLLGNIIDGINTVDALLDDVKA